MSDRDIFSLILISATSVIISYINISFSFTFLEEGRVISWQLTGKRVYIHINMDYEVEINEIKSELDELKDAVKSAKGEREHDINQRIIALETKSSNLFQLLRQQNATAGNSY
jgi:hypothetical protein